ncbi:hypothetical protein HMPREF1092_01243 [Clostridium thermobutyricum]|uniref:Reverse transcriptase domain-containing protein n=1 Tax=Clostridium thermobutyricum TaxID=29372 RepID=N9XQL8_9CLOT|nr:reverse transcriptase domain-containing protein [Clostridium thermobutyricum]ENZ02008.1 hypothetical protein HMPREF1092_01243 [Clostridium thermobutyricum]
MNYYLIKEETYKSYEYLINRFKYKYNFNLHYSGATDKENEELIANEIYTHFGTHYFKCINALNEMKVSTVYKNIIESVEEINILDIGCNVGTATYAYIDTYISGKDMNYTGKINIIFIEMSSIRVNWLKIMFEKYISEINKKYKYISINYNIICEKFPVDLQKIKERIIDAPIFILLSNFTKWNEERELAERINDLYIVDEKSYLLNIETNSQLTKIKNIVNYMKQYKIYEISGPTKRSHFKYDNLKCSHWKDTEYIYDKSYYQTNIMEQDMYQYINNGTRMRNTVKKTITTLNNLIITDEIELNYLIKNKQKIIDVARIIMKDNINKIYKDNYMEYRIPKKDGSTRPLIIEDAVNELISTSIIISIGLCIDNIQNKEISFGNRLEENEEVPYVTKNFMEQYFNKFISNQKKEQNEYKHYIKLDLKEYYKNIDHKKLLEILDQYLQENTWFENKEWLVEVINNYISRELIDTDRDKGIPQGIPLSGVLSNMYLNCNDKWFAKENCEDKILRYVDDMIIFTNKSHKKNIDKYTKFITNDLKLKLNIEKTESGEVKELEFYDLNNDFEEISKLCKKIYSSVYNLPSNIYNLYDKDNKRIIDMIYQCYNSIGISISKHWLSKKIRKRKAYSLGLKINYGKMFGKNKINISKWKKVFVRKNSIFISDLNRLKELLGNEFQQVYNQIKQGDNSILNIRKFKYLFNKLGVFTNTDVINEEIFNYVVNNPWLVDIKKFRGYPSLKKIVFSKINKDYTNYCNLMFIWLIGEYRAVEYINDVLEIYIDTIKIYTNELRVINTIACETILKLVNIDNISLKSIEEIKILLNRKIEDIPDYIYIRNMLMLINTVDSEWLKEQDFNGKFNLKLNGVWTWIKENLGENIIELLEPMYNNYGKYLPDEEPTGNFGSSY